MLILLCTLHAQAQHEYDKWYFGPGLNFTPGGQPQVMSQMYTHGGKWKEGTTSICDTAGNLLFYSDGDTVFNRNHKQIPNAISVNADGLNEGFKPIGLTDVREYSLSVYNRWGEKIFETNELSEAWNGIYLGHPVPVGAYLFIIRVITDDGRLLNESGTVTVVK